MAVKLTSSGLQSTPSYKPSASDITKKSTSNITKKSTPKGRTSGGGGGSSSPSSSSNAVQTLANVSGKEITTTDGKVYSPQSTIPVSKKLFTLSKIKSSPNQSSSGGVYINPITKEGVSVAPGGNVPKGYIKQTPITPKFITPEIILKQTKGLSTIKATDPFVNIKQTGTKQFRENLDLLSGGQYSASFFNNQQAKLNKQVEYFNGLYSGKSLTQEEYNKASEIARELEYAQKVLDRTKNRITGFTDRTIRSDLIQKSKLKSIAFGVVSAGAGAIVSASQTPEQIYSLLRNPRAVKDIHSNFVQGIKDSVNQNIQYIAINPYFGIARITTQIGIIYATGKLSAQGLKLLKQIRPGATKSLFKRLNKLSKVAKANISKVNINIRKVFQKGKLSGYDIDISGIGKGKISGKARSFAISRGKDKAVAISWGGIAREGRFVQGKVKRFISVGKSETRKLASGLYESAGKGRSLMRNRIYISRIGKQITEYNLDEFVTNSISRQLNKRLASFIGKAQSSSRSGIIYSGYIRDVSKSLTKAILTGSAKQIDDIYDIALRRFKQVTNVKLTSKIVRNKFDNSLVQVLDESTTQALRESQAVINSVAGAVARVQNKLSKRALKNVSKSAVRNATNVLVKKVTSSLVKGASISSVVNALQSAQAQRSIAKLLNVQLQVPQVKLTSRQIAVQISIPKLATAQKQTVVPILRTPGRKLIPIIPVTPIPEVKYLRENNLNGVNNLIRKQGGLYQGYEVAGRTPRRIMAITKYPASLNSSLSIATYFALHSPRGYAILTPSQKKVSKQVIDRPIRFGKDYYEKNKNKIVIIKKGRNVVIRRK